MAGADDLRELLGHLPDGHPEKPGLVRALEVLRHPADDGITVVYSWDATSSAQTALYGIAGFCVEIDGTDYEYVRLDGYRTLGVPLAHVVRRWDDAAGRGAGDEVELPATLPVLIH